MVRREDYEALQLKLRLAQFEIGKLKAMLYGKSSERLPAEDPAQLKLLMEREAALAPLPATPAAPAAPAPVEQTGVSAMESHVVQPGDKLGFSVDQDPTSGAPIQQIVSPFGLLSIPVSRCRESTVTVQAGKKTIKQIQDEIKALLEQEYYRVADVKITLVNPIVKLGQVWFRGAVRTSVIALDPGQPMTLWEALTRAGTTEFANLSKVKVERLDEASGKTETIYVNIDRVNKGNRDEDIILKDGDRVDVKEKWFTIL